MTTETEFKYPQLKQQLTMSSPKGRRSRIILVVLVLILAVYITVPMVFYSASVPTARQRVAETQAEDLAKMLDLSTEEQKIYEKIKNVEDHVEEQTDLLQSLRAEVLEKQMALADVTKRLDEEKRLRTKLDGLLREYQEAENPANAGQPKKSGGVEHVRTKVFPRMPETSIWCFGKDRHDRICKFRNLYYDPKRESFFVVITENSILDNVPDDRSPALMDGTSIDDHSAFYFNYDEVSPDKFKDQLVRHVEKRTFMFKRFHVGNIMHTMHDDILGLYYTIRRFSPVLQDVSLPEFASFSLDHYIHIMDGHPAYDYGKLFDLFTDFKVQYTPDLVADRDMITCFSEVIMGQSKALNWYHYGFLSPQGPIADKKVNGVYVRHAADFIKWRLGIIDRQSNFLPRANQEINKLVVFSRKENRLILNEDDLLNGLSEQFHLDGTFIRMEDMNFKQQVEVLSHTKVAIGMHGSILIMGMFMPRGSVLIELYPYAVPSENYTPYRTMTRLPGMNLAYRAWENKHKENNVMHPDRDMYHGGIAHLSEAEREQILKSNTVSPHICCTSPNWLFRIYQDTKVEISEVKGLIESALKESTEKNLAVYVPDRTIQPSIIPETSIVCALVYTGTKIEGIRLTWDEPWNGIKPDKYSIWEHLSYQEYFSDTNSIMIKSAKFVEGAEVQVWIRSVYKGMSSRYSDKHTCTISLPKPSAAK